LPNGAGNMRMIPMNMVLLSMNEKKPEVVEPPKQDPIVPDEEPEKLYMMDYGKQNTLKLFDKTAASQEQGFLRVSREIFEEQENRVISALRKPKKTAEDSIYLDWDNENRIMGLKFDPVWMESLTAGFEMAVETYRMNVSFDVVNPLFRKWIESVGMNRIKGINDTTREQLRITMADGIMNGESIDKLAERVKAVFANASDYRATLIARTETTATVNAGALDTYRAAGIKQKQWLATDDERVRPEHWAMNMEIVGIDDAFTNGSDGPDEPNCRCTVLPVIEGE